MIPRIWLALLLSVSCAGTPRRAPLVDIRTVAPEIRVDVRYSTKDNFTHSVLYPVNRCLLAPEAARHLQGVQADLKKDGLGLKVWDCYRPLSIQKKLWALVPDSRYVVDPQKGSRHNRGAAVDATIVDSAGKELEMPTAYDDFSEKARRDYRGSSPAATANRAKLEAVMKRHGFTGLPSEWWHFDFNGWEKYPIMDEPVE